MSNRHPGNRADDQRVSPTLLSALHSPLVLLLGKVCAVAGVPFLLWQLSGAWAMPLLYAPLLLLAPRAAAAIIFCWFFTLVVWTGYTGGLYPQAAFAVGMAMNLAAWRWAAPRWPLPGLVAGAGPALRRLFLGAAALLAVSLVFERVPVLEMLGLIVGYATVGLALPPRAPVGKAAPPARPGVLVGNALLVVVSSLFTVGALEVGARVLYGAPVPLYTQLHQERVWTPRPHSRGFYPLAIAPEKRERRHFTIGAEGLRNRDYGPKPAGFRRVLMLGDSFTFGSGIPFPASYPLQLEACLNQAGLHEPVQVVNAGVGGYGPGQELSLLKEIGLALEPDLVVLQLFLSNDLINDLMLEGKYPEAHFDIETWNWTYYRHTNRWYVRAHQTLCGKSALYRLLWPKGKLDFAILNFLESFRGGGLSPMPAIRRPNDRPWFLDANRKEWEPLLHEGWAHVQSHVLQIRDICQAHGIPLICFAIPNASTIIMDDLSPATHPYPAEDYERHKDVDIAEDFFRASGIDFVNLSQPMLAAPDPEALYYPYDGHLTAEGALFVARLLCGPVHDGLSALTTP